MLFYRRYRRTHNTPDQNTRQQDLGLYTTRAVVFDFDGTLTVADDVTTWEKIWVSLGYSINDCAQLHYEFSSSRIEHQEWCNITAENFKEKGFNLSGLKDVASAIRLVPGVRETITTLDQHGIKIYILSGSVRYIIKRVMGDLVQIVEDVRANEMYFDKSGKLTSIRGTKYDFRGKANYLRRLIRESGF